MKTLDWLQDELSRELITMESGEIARHLGRKFTLKWEAVQVVEELALRLLNRGIDEFEVSSFLAFAIKEFFAIDSAIKA